MVGSLGPVPNSRGGDWCPAWGTRPGATASLYNPIITAATAPAANPAATTHRCTWFYGGARLGHVEGATPSPQSCTATAAVAAAAQRRRWRGLAPQLLPKVFKQCCQRCAQARDTRGPQTTTATLPAVTQRLQASGTGVGHGARGPQEGRHTREDHHGGRGQANHRSWPRLHHHSAHTRTCTGAVEGQGRCGQGQGLHHGGWGWPRGGCTHGARLGQGHRDGHHHGLAHGVKGHGGHQASGSGGWWGSGPLRGSRGRGRPRRCPSCHHCTSWQGSGGGSCSRSCSGRGSRGRCWGCQGRCKGGSGGMTPGTGTGHWGQGRRGEVQFIREALDEGAQVEARG